MLATFDATHILVKIDFGTKRHEPAKSQVLLYDSVGKLVHQSDVTFESNINGVFQRQKLQLDAHETIVRVLTREYTNVNVSMRTPIFCM